jgi:hypothetical protein
MPKNSATDKVESKPFISSYVKSLVLLTADYITHGARIGYEMAKTASNPMLTRPFFIGGAILNDIPHVRATTPLGQIKFNIETKNKLIKAAQQTPNSIATYWAGPFLPVIYITSNEARRALIQESRIGSINQSSEAYLYWITGNEALTNFLGFKSINSKRYKMQRSYLVTFFHTRATRRLAEINGATQNFLKHYSQTLGESTLSIREFINRLVLNTSSCLLGLTTYTMDKIYLLKPEYRDAINNMVHYGLTQKSNPGFDKILFDLFCELLKGNFNTIKLSHAEEDFIHCIFASMNVDFPEQFEDFFTLPKETQFSIAMTFQSIMVGGLIHSTANSLDWAIARLLQDPKKMDELVQLMAKNKELDLSDESNFDKNGPLFKLSEWVLQNVFLYPTFAHQFFFNNKPYVVTLPDGVKTTIPGGSFILVNYLECNQGSKHMRGENFSKILEKQSTVGRFIMNKHVASFGGSQVNRENMQTRICPGAKTSLYEQIIIIGQLLRDYKLNLEDAGRLSCEVDDNKHPLCSRENTGHIRVVPQWHGGAF